MAALLLQVLDRGVDVVDGEPLAGRVPARRLDILDGRVEPRHLPAEACQRLADQPAAAADVEQASARRNGFMLELGRWKWRTNSSRT